MECTFDNHSEKFCEKKSFLLNIQVQIYKYWACPRKKIPRKLLWISFLSVLTTGQKVCRRSKKSTLKVRKSYKGIFSGQFVCLSRFPPTVVSSFDFPAKIFYSEFEIRCETFFRIALLLENVTWTRNMQFYHPCWKTVTKFWSIFRSSPEIIIEFNERRLSLERILWNHRELFWQQYQKFPPKVRSFCWIIKNKQ